MGRVLAATDIGSNTVHSLIAECAGGFIRRVENDSVWLSLGEVVSREGRFPERIVDQLVSAVQGFRRRAITEKAECMYLFATEAMRKASNHESVAKRLLKATGLTLNVITPRDEAELSLRGALIDSDDESDMTLIEVGGGSAQVAHIVAGEVHEEVSLPLGTGTLTARSGVTHPAHPEQIERVEALIEESLKELAGFPTSGRIVASGGVARGIWRGLHPDGDREIHRNDLGYLTWDSGRLVVETIVSRYTVKPRRAETFLTGSLVYLKLLERFGLESMTVSAYGVREGAVLSLAEGRLSGCLL